MECQNSGMLKILSGKIYYTHVRMMRMPAAPTVRVVMHCCE